MKTVCVLMSTYNGEYYLKEQIESILNQKGVNIVLLVRDDGSKDKTIDILKEYEKKGKLEWYTSKNVGPAYSFMDLLKNSQDYDYYAFADQDDYWEENKLKVAIEKLENSDCKNGKLYFSTLKIVDSNLNLLSNSILPKKITIKNEMIKNYATGCTMVFDKELKKIVLKDTFEYIAMHDSLICRIALLSNSYIYADDKSYIKYRQHSHNVLGMKTGIINKWKIRYDHFVNSKKLTQNTAKELIKHKDIIMNEQDYNYLLLLASYNTDKNAKKKLKKIKIFDNDEKVTRLLYKIKLLFNKI